MTFWTQENRDATSITADAAATGPRVGFLDAFSTSLEAQKRASASYGIENEMWQLENEQRSKLRKAGVENIPTLSPDSFDTLDAWMPGPNAGVDTYLNTARFYEDGGSPGFSDRLNAFDARIQELQKQYPDLGLRTSRDMWDEVKTRARLAEMKADTERRTFGGSLGGFIGGAAGGLNPNSDPLNFVTLPVGGAGKTVIGRIAGQAAAQGFVEGLNQITGVQEERRLLGLSTGVGDALSRVAGAAIGGAALQGLGEAAVKGFRVAKTRWFGDAPIEPPVRPEMPDTSQVPPGVMPADENLAAAVMTRDPATFDVLMHEQSPLGQTRMAKARTVLDVEHVTTSLQDWNGEPPWKVAPKTDTAITLPGADYRVQGPDLRAVADRMSIDDIARRVDPDAFRRYDALVSERSALRQQVEDTAGIQERTRASQAAAELDAHIADTTARLEAATSKKAKARFERDLADMREMRSKLPADTGPYSAAIEQSKLRGQLMQADYQMRDIAPLISRAYARAQEKWANTEADRRAIREMMFMGNDKLGPTTEGAGLPPELRDKLSRVAELRKQANDMQLSASYADDPKTAGREIAQARKMLDEANTIEEKLNADPRVQAERAVSSAEASLAERAPIMRDAARVADKVPKDATPVDVARAIVADNAKVIDEALSAYRGALDTMIKMEPDGEVSVAGSTRKLNLDKDKLVVGVDEEGKPIEKTVRQMLEDDKMSEHEIEAVSVCSLRKTS